MKKKLTFTLLGVLLAVTAFSQDPKKETEAIKTKMDVFASKTGVLTKFTDTTLPNLKTSYGVAKVRIRKIISGTSSGFFFQIEKEGKYGSSTASIEYSDLIEVIKAIKNLKIEVENDISSQPDYLENKFVTVDGFQVGYYVSLGKASWYLKLEKFGSDSTLFIENGDTIETAFNEAKIKMDELKK